MEKKKANMIAKLWNEQFAGSTDVTMTKAVVQEPSKGLKYYNTSWAVEIVADKENDGTCFYHVEEFSDIIRAFKVSGYVHIVGEIVVARLY